MCGHPVDGALAKLAERGDSLGEDVVLTLRLRVQMINTAVAEGWNVANAATAPIDLLGVNKRRVMARRRHTLARAAAVLQ